MLPVTNIEIALKKDFGCNDLFAKGTSAVFGTLLGALPIIITPLAGLNILGSAALSPCIVKALGYGGMTLAGLGLADNLLTQGRCFTDKATSNYDASEKSFNTCMKIMFATAAITTGTAFLPSHHKDTTLSTEFKSATRQTLTFSGNHQDHIGYIKPVARAADNEYKTRLHSHKKAKILLELTNLDKV